jgi:hypothetical protein
MCLPRNFGALDDALSLDDFRHEIAEEICRAASGAACIPIRPMSGA